MNTLIAKEHIADFQIIPAFVDKTEFWKDELEYAVRLGNEHKGKSVITFETTQGPKSVETTVWSVTDKFLTLKSGTTIPLSSIIDIHH